MTANPPKYKKKAEPFFYSSQRQDTVFLVMVLVVLLVGLIMMFSASYITSYFENDGDSYYFIKRQLIFAGMGIVAMLVMSRINYKKLFTKHMIGFYYAVCVMALVMVLFIGEGEGVEKRWIQIGSITTVQPSEFAKLAVILLLAYYFATNAKKLKKPLYGILVPALIIGLIAGLVLAEPHLSGTILILGVGVAMMVVAGSNFVWISVMGVAAVAGLWYVCMNVEYMKARVDIWQDPWSDELGNGYQTIQSLYAIGSGGLTGLGLGQSRQKFLYLPKPQNDYVFAIVAEELGFIGCVVILALFAFLIYRGFVIAMRSDSRFGSLLAFGITFRLALQVILNIAVVTNAIPCTGISLPFFSSGGTALFVQLAEMGIILSVSRQSNVTKA